MEARPIPVSSPLSPGHPMAQPLLREVLIPRCSSGMPCEDHGQKSCTIVTCRQDISHEETPPSWNKRHLWRSLYQLHEWRRSRAKKVRAANVISQGRQPSTGEVSAHHAGGQIHSSSTLIQHLRASTPLPQGRKMSNGRHESTYALSRNRIFLGQLILLTSKSMLSAI